MGDSQVSRRTVIASLAVAGAGLAAAAFAPLVFWNRIPAHGRWTDRRLTAALRGLFFDSGAGIPSIAGAGWSRERAVRCIAEDASHFELAAALADAEGLRAHLEQLQQRDFGAGRTQLHDGWLLSETEIAVAVLLDG